MTTPAYDVDTLDLVHKSGYEIIPKAEKKKNKLPFRHTFGEKYVAVIMFGLNKKSGKLLHDLMTTRNTFTNEVQYRVQGSKAKSQLARSYKELYEKNLIKRTCNTWYMINPEAILPLFDRYEELVQKWNSI